MRFQRQAVVFVAVVLSTAVSAFAAERRWSERLAFLVGTWTAEGGGAPGEATGSFDFAEGLNGNVLIRKNRADYPATASHPAMTHEDLMIVYPENGKVRADYYDTEGHVIHYTVNVPATNRAVFVSDVVAGAPRFRLTYDATVDGQLNGTFETAPPGKPDAFAPYLSWKSRRSAASK